MRRRGRFGSMSAVEVMPGSDVQRARTGWKPAVGRCPVPGDHERMRRLSALLIVLSLCGCQRPAGTGAESVTPVPNIDSLRAAAADGDPAASDRVVSYYLERAPSFPASERMRWDRVAANNGSISGAFALAVEYYHRNGPSDCRAAQAWANVVLARAGDATDPNVALEGRSAEDLLNKIQSTSCRGSI